MYKSLTDINDRYRPIYWSWFLLFLLKSSYILGYTITISLTIGRLGLFMFPALMLVKAILHLISSGIVINKVNHNNFNDTFIMFAFSGVVLLLLSPVFASYSIYLFLLVLLIVFGVFNFQLKIMSDILVEELFSEEQSQKSLPIIETAGTVAGIIIGSIIYLYSDSLNLINFIYIWSITLLGLIPFGYSFPKIKSYKEYIENKVEHIHNRSNLHFNDHNFLKLLGALTLFISFYKIIFDYQYASVIINFIEKSHSLSDYASLENAYAHVIGSLFLLFSICSLFIELFLSSKIIKKIGSIDSMSVHFMVSALGIISMLLKFNLINVLITKLVYKMSKPFYKNGYNLSFYHFANKIKIRARQYVDAIYYSGGIIIATILIMLLNTYHIKTSMILTIILIVTLFILMYITFLLKKLYLHKINNVLFKDVNKESNITYLKFVHQNDTDHYANTIYKLITDSKTKKKTINMILQSINDDTELIDTIHFIKIIESNILNDKQLNILLNKIDIIWEHNAPINNNKVIKIYLKLLQKKSNNKRLRLIRHINIRKIGNFINEYIKKSSDKKIICLLKSLYPISKEYKLNKYVKYLKSSDNLTILLYYHSINENGGISLPKRILKSEDKNSKIIKSILSINLNKDYILSNKNISNLRKLDRFFIALYKFIHTDSKDISELETYVNDEKFLKANSIYINYIDISIQKKLLILSSNKNYQLKFYNQICKLIKIINE